MDLLDNPFWLLGATPRDNRRRIVELAEKQSLLSDENIIASASSTLINPRKRLSAEIAWLPGINPRRASEMVALIQENPREVFSKNNIPALARGNLFVSGLRHVVSQPNNDGFSKKIIEIAKTFNEIDAKTIKGLINEERKIAGFPIVSDEHALEAELQNCRRYYRATINEVLNTLSLEARAGVVTKIVESVTNMGKIEAPLLIDDVVDTYEVEVQEFLEHETTNINQLIGRILDMADEGKSESQLNPLVDELIAVVKNWDAIAQPIQVSTKSRGLRHAASQKVAHSVREAAIHLFNKHDKLNLSKKITNMIQEVFAEVVDVAEIAGKDAFTLDEIARQRKLSSLLNPISDLCTKVLENATRNPSNAYNEIKKVRADAPKLLSILNREQASETLISNGKDMISLTLMQCAIIYGNETNKWKKCIEVLEEAMKYAANEESRKRIRENLLIASRNRSPHQNPTTVGDVFGIAIVIIILVIFYNAIQDSKTNSPSRAKNSPSVTTSSVPTSRSDFVINFEKPSIGRDNVLSVAQLRWCFRESIRIMAKRQLISRETNVTHFNQSVVDYNRRCGEYKYHKDDLARAKREVERMRSQIIADIKGGNKNSDFDAVYETQMLLTKLGYNPGKIDGIYGRKTRTAIESFERNIGKIPTGNVTDEILYSMRISAIKAGVTFPN